MARIVNVTIPVECEDEEGLHKFMTAMATGMNKLAEAAAPLFGVKLMNPVESEELVPIDTFAPAERKDV